MNVKTVSSYTTAQALKAIETALESQGKVNDLWFTAQRAAVYVALKDKDKDGALTCQLTPLTRLVQAVVSAKALRAKELVQFIVTMFGGDAQGNGGLVRWVEKDKAFKKGKASWTEEAVLVAFGKATGTAWFEWAKPAKTDPYNINALFSAIRKACSAVADGECIPTDAQAKFLKDIQAAALANGFAGQIEPK